MLITIGMKALQVECVIGVSEEERKTPQTLLIDIDLTYNAKKAVAEDSVDYVIDYRLLEKICNQITKTAPYLLETFASELFDRLFALQPICFLKVKVSKKAYEIPAHSTYAQIKKEK